MTMPPERTEHAIAFLIGETHALLMAVQALITSHPDPQALSAQLDTVVQAGLAKVEWLPVKSDAVTEGYQFASEVVRKAAKAAAGNQ